MYKMAVLDIDGTILNSSGKLSRRTVATIRNLSKREIPVCLCTGRNITHTLPIAKKLNIKTPFMTVDGKIMYDLTDKKLVYENKLATDTAVKIIEAVNGEHAYMEAVTPFNYVKYIKSNELSKYSYGGQSFILKDMINGVKYAKNISELKSIADNVVEIIAAGSKEALDNIKCGLKDENIDINDLWDGYLIITPKNGRKSDGVKVLCDYYSIDMNEVLAIGDENNDIDMIAVVGMGVAMGNATEKVKKVADYITASNDMDGAALALLKYFAN